MPVLSPYADSDSLLPPPLSCASRLCLLLPLIPGLASPGCPTWERPNKGVRHSYRQGTNETLSLVDLVKQGHHTVYPSISLTSSPAFPFVSTTLVSAILFFRPSINHLPKFVLNFNIPLKLFNLPVCVLASPHCFLCAPSRPETTFTTAVYLIIPIISCVLTLGASPAISHFINALTLSS